MILLIFQSIFCLGFVILQLWPFHLKHRYKVPLPNTSLSSKIVYKVLRTMLIQRVVINTYMNQNGKLED